MVICNVAKILELVVPLMDHPSESFLTTIEEDLMKLILKYGMTVSDVHLILNWFNWLAVDLHHISTHTTKFFLSFSFLHRLSSTV